MNTEVCIDLPYNNDPRPESGARCSLVIVDSSSCSRVTSPIPTFFVILKHAFKPAVCLDQAP